MPKLSLSLLQCAVCASVPSPGGRYTFTKWFPPCCTFLCTPWPASGHGYGLYREAGRTEKFLFPKVYETHQSDENHFPVLFLQLTFSVCCWGCWTIPHTVRNKEMEKKKPPSLNFKNQTMAVKMALTAETFASEIFDIWHSCPNQREIVVVRRTRRRRRKKTLPANRTNQCRF